MGTDHVLKKDPKNVVCPHFYPLLSIFIFSG
ncbi:hypothetical protein PS624_04402 [Pseudomonas fluorescens]|uniref:Uncharacterized protein n=1 Tax=Pseudomonas fluorescens TaxID=294 RepID=A0A5E6W0U7_PSEFL|nr:hypothetical protein PS624_04402 [Pseudomonas fluorescens]